MNISHLLTSGLLVLVFGTVSTVSYAAQYGSIKVTSIAQVEVQTTGPDGQAHVSREPVNKAVPGTLVIFSDTFQNVGRKPASNIVINNPVPANTAYQAGSAYGKYTVITFSVDGGKTYAAPEDLKSISTDGYGQIAKPADYTNIRWSYQKQLAPGETGEVGFRTVIK